MKTGDLCSREVYIVKRGEPLAEAVREMRNRRVGTIVVAEEANAVLRPVGIVTDRDVVCGQIAHHADLFCLAVDDVMTRDPFTVAESSDVGEAVQSLCRRGVRRAPVVDEAGGLVGLISLDDLVPAVAQELSALAQLIGNQSRNEVTRAGSQTAGNTD